jgi:hypothetical protein
MSLFSFLEYYFLLSGSVYNPMYRRTVEARPYLFLNVEASI